MADRPVTEFDLRADEFKHPSVKPEDYEFRSDGKIVRKDRWQTGIHRIHGMVGPAGGEFEIDAVCSEVWKAEKARRTLDELRALLMQSVNAPKPDGLNDLQRGVDSGKRVVLETLETLAAEHDYQFSIPSQGTSTGEPQ